MTIGAWHRPDRAPGLCVMAILLLAVACDGGEDRGNIGPTAAGPDTEDGTATEANEVEIASSFVEAIGAFDTEEAITHLADDAEILDLIGSVGAHRGVAGTPEELPLLISLLKAAGYRQTLDSCEAKGASVSGALVECTFDFHLFGSDRLGLGPYGGSSFDLVVDDGAIVRAGASFEVEEFSSQMWEPFEAWVSQAHPQDAAAMYDDESHGGMRLSAESISLWKRHVLEYVREMR